jgi:methyl-accepting chemotaxis protein
MAATTRPARQRVAPPSEECAGGASRGTDSAVDEVMRLVNEVTSGHLDARGDVRRFSGQDAELVAVVNRMVDALVRPMRTASRAIDQIAHGRIPEFIIEEYPGEFNDIKRNVNTFLATMYGMHHEMQNLVRAITEGKLNTRGNDWDFEGNWQEMIKGVNQAIDAFVGPYRVAATYVDRISDGDIPDPLKSAYRGDFNQIRKNLNRLISTLNSFATDMQAMSEAHKAGEIDAVIPEGRFDGAYRAMAIGVNQGTRLHIDVLFRILDILTAYADGDFTPVLERLPGKQAVANEKMNQLQQNLRTVVAELADLARAAVEGRLDRRVEADRFSGDWHTLASGINDTLDAVINPISEARGVLNRLSRYDLTARVHGDYRGDHAQIKDALNLTASALHDALVQVADLVARVSGAGTRIAEISQGVAAGAAEQARSVEETSSSLKEIGLGSVLNVEKAGQALTITKQALASAEAGTSAAGRMIEAVQEIRHTTGDSLSIVQDIDGIAHQTDDLARNASVQATHVGEASRGFAVVAQAVRDLAARSRDTAQQLDAFAQSDAGRAGASQASGRSAASDEKARQVAHEIDQIAIQTNVLAVNAAIEAAHVEAAGIGLEAVTEKVRELASRSKDSALKTGAQLEASARLAADGSAMSDEIGMQLMNLVDAVQEVASLVEGVANASQDQKRAVETVAESVGLISAVTQRNAEGARASSVAAEDLAREGQALEALVARFTLDRTKAAQPDQEREAA